jgi:hypothetical protein
MDLDDDTGTHGRFRAYASIWIDAGSADREAIRELLLACCRRRAARASPLAA